MKKVSYFICDGVTVTDLREYVLIKCHDGWIPTGGITIDPNATRGWIKYYQALVKETEEEPCTKN